MNETSFKCNFTEVVWNWDFPLVDLDKKMQKGRELVSFLCLAAGVGFWYDV